MLNDTIAAIATPSGEGGLAVVRVSGPQAMAVADNCFLPVGKNSLKPSAASSHTIHYGKIVRDEKVIDSVLLAVLRGPRTYTGEDTVEISCHGGLLPAKLILDTLLAGGARMAGPGEFTRRAFLNGRIDLAQAEAVADLIHSRSELALAAAHGQLGGSLSRRINRIRDDLMQALAHVEAHIDFPDEDIAPDAKAQLLGRLRDAVALMDVLLRTANEGKILRSGVRAAIVGRPNAGKSSLLNQLLGHERAIVSHIAGTTRDTIEETANIRGVPVVFVDTAGLRESHDEIEREGVRRSRESLALAELILHVIDGSQALAKADSDLLAEFAGKKRIVVRNKTDLRVLLDIPLLDAPVVDVCCVSGQGIEALKDAIQSLVWAGGLKPGIGTVAINSRHQDALSRARAAAQQASAALSADATLELVAMDLRIAAGAIGEVVGKTTTEDLLDNIFSSFCIGK